MQATVFSHDPDHGTSVVTDDGVRLHADAAVFARSGLRWLRAGQRVSITVEADEVTRLWIVGIGEDETIA
ncbi:hypothetical protein N5P18_01175 [Janibacter terrae]|uniref:Cold-shock protein n=1 Tax=Janibacter terrae TaxID=103817 RepID=A0ABZ2FDW9_9MICO|nr:hypothetical protein [Janibacter terrae]MBA4083699.1 hypothetical protein [Kytococcus sp.]HBO54041.1 hypothetical protein [Janibacter terrae]HCE60474.1 hypothetical protein [Janibacter terrae]